LNTIVPLLMATLVDKSGFCLFLNITAYRIRPLMSSKEGNMKSLGFIVVEL